jgi:hypothetical protein
LHCYCVDGKRFPRSRGLDIKRRKAINRLENHMNRDNRFTKAISSLVDAGFFFSSAFALELLFLRSGVPTMAVFAISSLVIGALGYGIVLERRRRKDQQRQVLEDRLETISEINHHVRNVLSVVAFYGMQTKNIYTTRMINDALVRMEGIMRGVLSRWGFQETYSTWLKSSPPPPSPPSPSSPNFADSVPSHGAKASHERIHLVADNA